MNTSAPSCFVSCRRTGQFRSFLSTDAANKLAVSLILSRLDYCISFPAGLSDSNLNKLQCIQNNTARLVLCKPRHASATSLFRTLHWYSAKACIQYKIGCRCFQCIYHNSMQLYLSDLILIPLSSNSFDTRLLTIPCICLETSGKISSFYWTHCLEPPFIIPQETVFHSFQKRNERTTSLTFLSA